MRQPNGASYGFFKDLLPPLRYVNAAFRHYPIVLSAPLGAQKIRLVSNGSAINARANKSVWRDVGFPVTFIVSESAQVFGNDIERLDGPRYAEGYLPIVQMAYEHDGAVYAQETFAAVEPELAKHGVVFVRFNLQGESPGQVLAQTGFRHAVKVGDGVIWNIMGQPQVLFDTNWCWEPDRKGLVTTFAHGRSATLAIFSQPAQLSLPALTLERYEQHREACAQRWKDILQQGIRLETPESIVNNAWRSTVIGNFINATDDYMYYSAMNAYAKLCEAESGDPARALMLYGFENHTRRMLGPLLDFNRDITRFHVAGMKLQLLGHYYWVTRDVDTIRALEPVWRSVVEFILRDRKPSHGLLEGDRYAADIAQLICSSRSNANCWRGLRDIAAVLEDMGEHNEARRLMKEAKVYRDTILKAIAQSERHDSDPPYIPIALFVDEEPPHPLTATRAGSYYDLVAPYLLGSNIFGHDSQRERWLLDYLRQHGGIAMGMVRCKPHRNEFNQEPGVNPLYALRYRLTLLRRDEREQAIVGFYGQLAQGMTQDTFIGGEGTRFLHGDEHGRSFYLPPNSAVNAAFLHTLRYLIVQDWDLDEDFQPDTLRLLYGVPRRWLKDGCVLAMQNAPTAFGEVSIRVESQLYQGHVTVQATPPPRPVSRFLLRPPMPDGWKVTSARVGEAPLSLMEDGAVDLTGRQGEFTIRFGVESTAH